jgi:hypothetical protein
MASLKKDTPNTESHDQIDARIEKLKQEAAALSDGQMRAHVSADCPAGVEEQFWRRVIAFENAPQVEPFQVLVQSGITLPPPEEIDAAQLPVTLWNAIHGMASIGMYLDSTDHLSDRELYVRLWTDVLREPTELDPADRGAAWHIDLVSRGSEEDIRLYLTYYADEEDRRTWAEEWPDYPMPDAAELPFDRDRHLPQPRYGR